MHPSRLYMKGVLCVLQLIIFTKCINLRYFGINDIYYASSIAVHGNRAFLSLPRSSCYNNHTQPTLVEVPWNTNRRPLSTGRRNSFPLENSQNWGRCNSIQDATSVEIESKPARLWVLDRGTKKCPPKLVIYSLLNHLQIISYSLDGIANDKDLSFMLLDLNGLSGPKVYITDSSTNRLIVFCLNSKKTWLVRITQQDGSELPFKMNRLALSKNEPKLYITCDESDDMVYINAEYIRNYNNSEKEEIQNVTASFTGKKLGPSGGITTDMADGLNYYSTRDYAVLRWKTRSPLIAENHDVIMQSYEKLPYVSHLFSTAQNEVYALVNPGPPLVCHTAAEKKNMTFTDLPTVKKRFQKLSKFTKVARRGSLSFITETDL